MILGSLSAAELRRRLQGAGLDVLTGPFTVRLQTSIPSVADGLMRLYGDHPITESGAFADFHVSLDRPAGFRRWIKPQVLFRFDGKCPFKPLPLPQAFPMLEWGLNWCVANHANAYLILHAAVVERNGFAAVLPAPPGSGKSTLCAALVHRGWRLLSDELTLIRVADGKIIPLPRPVSLKNQSIGIMQAYLPDGTFTPAVADTVKGTVAYLKPPVDSVRRAGESAVPGWIIFPKYQANAPVRLTAVPRSRALLRVAENAFNFNVLGRSGFETLARTIDVSACFEFSYSVLDEAVEAFAALRPGARES